MTCLPVARRRFLLPVILRVLGVGSCCCCLSFAPGGPGMVSDVATVRFRQCCCSGIPAYMGHEHRRLVSILPSQLRLFRRVGRTRAATVSCCSTPRKARRLEQGCFPRYCRRHRHRLRLHLHRYRRWTLLRLRTQKCRRPRPPKSPAQSW